MANTLKDFPPEVKKAVLLKQAELKIEKNQPKYSHRHTLVQIVKEWIELKSKK